jgi:hypothetical protein
MLAQEIRSIAGIIAVTVTLLLECVTTAGAQGITEDSATRRLLDCGAIEDAEKRLNCFDAAVESLRTAPTAAQNESQLGNVRQNEFLVEQSSPEGSGRVIASTEPTVAGVAASSAHESEPTGRLSDGETEAPTPVATSSESAVAGKAGSDANQPGPNVDSSDVEAGLIDTVAVPSPDYNYDYGYERTRAQKLDISELVPFEATIVKVRQHHDGRFSVELNNGQIWRETQGSKVRTPKAGQLVEVRKGKVGGYRMKIEGVPSLASVRLTN